MASAQSMNAAALETGQADEIAAAVDLRDQSGIASLDEGALSGKSSADERTVSGTAQSESAAAVEKALAEIAAADERAQSASAAADEKAQSETSAPDEGGRAADAATDEKVQSGNANADAGSESNSTSADEGAQSEIASQDEKEEEEEECGFCLFMKGGPCGSVFTVWQECVDGAEKSEKDIVQQCAQMTTLLKECMEMNPEYYGPILDAEKDMEAEVSTLEGIGEGNGKSGEASTGSEDEAAQSADGGEVLEVVEASDVVVDEEGQAVEEVDSVEVKEDEAAQSVDGGEVLEVVEASDVVVDEEGQVVEEVYSVEVKVAAG